MLFDARAALARIRDAAPPVPVEETQPEPKPGANRANRAKPDPQATADLAPLARLARPQPSEPKNAPLSGGAVVLPLHGHAARPAPVRSAPAVPLHGGMVRLDWSGEWVSRDRWDAMTDLERHGPQGRLFCGRCWQYRDGASALACLDGRPCP